MPGAAVDIRPATTADTASLAGLSGQLGYPVLAESLQVSLARLLSRADQIVYVAEESGVGVLGWIHGAEQELLESGRRCEILGLVVDQGTRRRGAGRRLVEAVERWAARRGLGEVSVRSAVSRAESHPFYERLGYDAIKTQHVYRKRLSPGAAAE